MIVIESIKIKNLVESGNRSHQFTLPVFLEMNTLMGFQIFIQDPFKSGIFLKRRWFQIILLLKKLELFYFKAFFLLHLRRVTLIKFIRQRFVPLPLKIWKHILNIYIYAGTPAPGFLF